jgi:hypothetical protein
MSAVMLVVLALAAYRGTRFLVEDHLFSPVRDRIWNRWGPETKFGYLFTCYWCMGFWVSSVIALGYILISSVTFIVCLPLALSAAVGIISKIVDRD